MKIWTDKTDYVVAESAEAARLSVMHASGLTDEEVGPLGQWRAYRDDEPFPWADDEGAPVTKIPAAEAVRRLTVDGGAGVGLCKIDGCACRASFYFASTEW